ncbi:MAG: NUDIX hydrolase [Oscillospiraceae bacterium]|nr:NUDIX hydrolase [Oscillospiraceae bacterium]
MDLFETKLDGRLVYQGRIVNVREDRVRLPDGRVAAREVVEHSGGVGIVALTDEGDVLMVRQFRYPMGEIVREIPAGKLEPGEDPAACAARELREETGYTCARLDSLGVTYPSPGCYGEKLYLFLARTLTYVGQALDDQEFLVVESLPLDALVAQIMSGEIKDGKTIIGVLKARWQLTIDD